MVARIRAVAPASFNCPSGWFRALRAAFGGALAAVLFAACTTYEYIPPTSDAGRQCVASCENARQVCIAGSHQTAATNKASCETRETNRLALCLAAARDQAARDQCSKGRNNCFAVADTYRCENSHRACFTTCGGQVIEKD